MNVYVSVSFLVLVLVSFVHLLVVVLSSCSYGSRIVNNQ